MKRFLPVLLLVLICIFSFTACNKNEVEDNTPLPSATISVKTAEDLANIKNFLGPKYVNYTFSLENDIDLASFTQWDSIGNADAPFCSAFIGNGKTISNLSYIGMDTAGKPTVAEFKNNIALFGFTKNAKISDLTLSGVNLNLYTYGDYFHTAGLVAYNIGSSEFKNITINGKIDLSNIYVYNTTYGMDGKVQDDRVVTCNTTQYVGGVVAYSSGSSTFDNIDVNLDIKNKYYRAVYEIEEEEVDGKTVIVNKGYTVHTYSNQAYLPHQTLAGYLGGYIKNGAEIDDVNVTGKMEIYAKSVYGAPIAAILVGGQAENLVSNNSNLILRGSEKVGASGAIALIDSSKVSDVTVNTLTINAEPIGGSVKNISIGGIASYCYDLAILSGSTVTNFNAATTEKDKLQLGGIAGVVRDATVTDNTSSGVFSVNGSNKVDQESYLSTASIVYAAYGNAVVKNNSANIDITLKDGVTYTMKSSRIYGVMNNTPYVNEDGKTVTRFAHDDNVKDYVEVSITHDKENEIIAKYHDSEGRELGTVTFAVDDSLYTLEGENCFKYLAAYYVEGTGLINADKNALSFSGKSFALYKQITGVPIISDNVLVN